MASALLTVGNGHGSLEHAARTRVLSALLLLHAQVGWYRAYLGLDILSVRLLLDTRIQRAKMIAQAQVRIAARKGGVRHMCCLRGNRARGFGTERHHFSFPNMTVVNMLS